LRHQTRGSAATPARCTHTLVATMVRTNDACFLPLASPARSPHDYNGATRSSKTSPHTKQISPRSPPHPPRAYSWRGRGGAADPAAPRPTPPPPSTQSPPAVGASPPGSDSPVPPSPGARPVGARSGMRRRPSARRVTAATAAGGHPFHQPPAPFPPRRAAPPPPSHCAPPLTLPLSPTYPRQSPGSSGSRPPPPGCRSSTPSACAVEAKFHQANSPAPNQHDQSREVVNRRPTGLDPGSPSPPSPPMLGGFPVYQRPCPKSLHLCSNSHSRLPASVTARHGRTTFHASRLSPILALSCAFKRLKNINSVWSISEQIPPITPSIPHPTRSYAAHILVSSSSEAQTPRFMPSEREKNPSFTWLDLTNAQRTAMLPKHMRRYVAECRF